MSLVRFFPIVRLSLRRQPLASKGPSTSLPSYSLRKLSSTKTTTTTTDSGTNGQEKENPKDKAKVRRAYALGGCLMFIWISTHGLLLYRRRTEYRNLNEKMPPIPWEEFAEKYLAAGQVKTIVYQPHFQVGNVYLHSANEQLMKKTVVSMFRAAPDKFSRPPDVRFFFEGDQKEMEKAVLRAQKTLVDSGNSAAEVEFSLDQFPSYRELSFIIGSTLFTLASVTLMKL